MRCALLVLLSAVCASAAPSQQPLASVNLVHALWAPWNTTAVSLSGIASAAKSACAERGFTTVRVAGSPFWPTQGWPLYLADEAAYWAAAAPFADALAAGGCSMVYNLFWDIFVLPDLFGEPLGALVAGALGDTSSKSFATSLRYIDAFVGKFAASQPVAAWELTNELNLLFDLDMSTQCPCCGGPGAPKVRTRADNISTDGGIALLTAWAARIRAADPLKRPISTGHGLARPSAEHLRAAYLKPSRDWTPDTFPEFEKNLADISSCCEWASVHLYPGTDNARFGKTGPNDPTIVWFAQAAAAAANKTLLVGEFGELPLPGSSPDAPRPFVDGMLNALAKPQPPGLAGVTAAALQWTWEFGDQNGTDNGGWALWPGVTDGAIDAMIAYNGAAE
jgi:hypothetical protein